MDPEFRNFLVGSGVDLDHYARGTLTEQASFVTAFANRVQPGTQFELQHLRLHNFIPSDAPRLSEYSYNEQ